MLTFELFLQSVFVDLTPFSGRFSKVFVQAKKSDHNSDVVVIWGSTVFHCIVEFVLHK